MELPGLANPKRSALGGIASLTYSSTAEHSEAKTPGAGFRRPIATPPLKNRFRPPANALLPSTAAPIERPTP